MLQLGITVGLSSTQTMPGLISDINMWSKAFSLDELQRLECDSQLGDVVNMNTLEVYHHDRWVDETFPCAGKWTMAHFMINRSEYI